MEVVYTHVLPIKHTHIRYITIIYQVNMDALPPPPPEFLVDPLTDNSLPTIQKTENHEQAAAEPPAAKDPLEFFKPNEKDCPQAAYKRKAGFNALVKLQKAVHTARAKLEKSPENDVLQKAHDSRVEAFESELEKRTEQFLEKFGTRVAQMPGEMPPPPPPPIEVPDTNAPLKPLGINFPQKLLALTNTLYNNAKDTYGITEEGLEYVRNEAISFMNEHLVSVTYPPCILSICFDYESQQDKLEITPYVNGKASSFAISVGKLVVPSEWRQLAKSNGMSHGSRALDLWINSDSKRRAERIAFLPPKDVINDPYPDIPNYNRFTGYRYSYKYSLDMGGRADGPGAKGFVEYMYLVFGHNGKEIVERVLDICAYQIQRPGDRKVPVGIVTQGGQGLGKTTLAKIMAEIVGSEYTFSTKGSKALENRFYDVRDRLILIFNEMFGASYRGTLSDTLKGLIGDDTDTLETKHVQRTTTVRYHFLTFITANDGDNAAVHIESDDQHYIFMTVAPNGGKPRNLEYLYTPEALADISVYLHTRKYNPESVVRQAAAQTPATYMAKLKGLSPFQSFICALLTQYRHIIDRPIEKDMVMQCYEMHMKRYFPRTKVKDKSVLFKELHGIFPEMHSYGRKGTGYSNRVLLASSLEQAELDISRYLGIPSKFITCEGAEPSSQDAPVCEGPVSTCGPVPSLVFVPTSPVDDNSVHSQVNSKCPERESQNCEQILTNSGPPAVDFDAEMDFLLQQVV